MRVDISYLYFPKGFVVLPDQRSLHFGGVRNCFGARDLVREGGMDRVEMRNTDLQRKVREQAVGAEAERTKEAESSRTVEAAGNGIEVVVAVAVVAADVADGDARDAVDDLGCR